MLTLSEVSLRRGPRELMHGVSLAVHAGWRVGVVGRNGSGKSSLFALLTGDLAADAGQVSLPRDWTLAAVAQETPAVPQPAIDYVLDGDEALRAVERALAQAESRGDVAAIAAAHERLDTIDGYAAPSRAAAMLHGLGFSTRDQQRPVAEFSGGWRMRLNLARALMRRADLLLLDEPTNHLDLDAVLWLEQTLSEYRGTLLLISHDRDFLDATTTHTLHIHDGGARLYSGGYSSFERQRAEQLTRQAAEHASQQRRVRELQRFVDRFRAKASKARQAQARLKMIERIGEVAAVHAEAEFQFEFAQPERLPAPMVRLEDVSVGYGGTPLLSGIRWTLGPGDRVGLLGANGAGKTTLMRLLSGEQPALAGECLRDAHLRVGYFAQHQLEKLDPQASPLLHLLREQPDMTEQAARDHLGRFLFRGDRVFDPVQSFSGGERARLALALLVRRRPNLLLLDEPTNHLDLDLRQALEMALQEFSGAVVLVSHDRHLLRSTCDELWLVADGAARAFDGDLEDYARWLSRRRAQGALGAGVHTGAAQTGTTGGAVASRSPDGAADANSVGGPSVRALGTADETQDPRGSARDRRRAAAEQRERLRPLRDEVRRLEREMGEQRRRLDEIESELSDPELYAGNGPDGAWVTARSREQADLRRALEAAEERWLEVAETLQAEEAAGGS